jgi:hypothetical protein
MSLIHNTRQKGGKGDHKVRNNTHQKKVEALIKVIVMKDFRKQYKDRKEGKYWSIFNRKKRRLYPVRRCTQRQIQNWKGYPIFKE